MEAGKGELPHGTEERHETPLEREVFSYLAEHLYPRYQSELERVRKEGSSEQTQEFNSSQLARIAGEIIAQSPDLEETPQNPILNLSSEDVEFIREALHPPVEMTTEWFLHGEMMRKLKDSYEASVRNGQKRSIADRVLSAMRRTRV